MKKFLLASAALLAVAGAVPAFAADIPAPVYKAPMSAPPVFSWTGFYIGGTAGYGWSRDTVDDPVVASFCNVTLGGCAPNQFSNALVAGIPTSLSTNAKGFIGGGEFGYNYQTGSWVWGIETDLSWTDIKGAAAALAVVPVVGFPGSTVTTATANATKLDWFGTVRGRIGYTVVPQLLVYGTGGLAYGRVEAATAITEQVGGPCFCGPNPFTAAAVSTTRVGWTAGGGLAWAIDPHWSVKAEYLYYDLGSTTFGVPPLTQLNAAGVPFFGATVNSTANFKGSIVRAGLDYKFDWGGPVVTRY